MRHVIKSWLRKTEVETYKGNVLSHDTSTGTEVSSFRNQITYRNWRQDSLVLQLSDGRETVVKISDIDLTVRVGHIVSAFYAGKPNKRKWAIALYNHTTDDLYFSAPGLETGLGYWSFPKFLLTSIVLTPIVLVGSFIFILETTSYRSDDPKLSVPISIIFFVYLTTSYIVRLIRCRKVKEYIRQNLHS